MKPSWTLILSIAFVAYMLHSVYQIYKVYHPESCPVGKNYCIVSFLRNKPLLELRVYASVKKSLSRTSSLRLLWKNSTFMPDEFSETTVNVSLPKSTRDNGTLYFHVVMLPRGLDLDSGMVVTDAGLLTAYMPKRPETFNLFSSDSEQTTKQEIPKTASTLPVAHWRQKVYISCVSEFFAFNRYEIPAEIYPMLKVTSSQEYLPLLFVDNLSSRVRDLVPINSTSKQAELSIYYTPVTVGRLRLWKTLEQSLGQMKNLGFTEKDTDEVKSIFTDTNIYFLLLTFLVSIFHLLFDFLAFKNDINYWRHRRTMTGLSTSSVIWRCGSTIVIFLYLLDQDTSLLVLIPAGVGTLIEVWKVTKAFKVHVSWPSANENRSFPSITFGPASDQEKETGAFDNEAMKYIKYILYPLCLAGALYSLLYIPHKSWYSWCVQCLVNGVYAFGFIFMLPQLFINYKLKSVAHLPWRAFMYKAFNTFIDDVFAFIITMPTAHRLACFRDDVVFVIYLYQRWLYPVDKTRVNEYGESFEELATTQGSALSETKKTQ